MKKVLFALLLICSFSYASVLFTSLGCENKSDLKAMGKVDFKGKNASMEKLYKYAIENNCEIIRPSDKIKQMGKATKDGFIKVYVEGYDKHLFIFSKNVKNKYSKSNHLLKKSF